MHLLHLEEVGGGGAVTVLTVESQEDKKFICLKPKFTSDESDIGQVDTFGFTDEIHVLNLSTQG